MNYKTFENVLLSKRVGLGLSNESIIESIKILNDLKILHSEDENGNTVFTIKNLVYDGIDIFGDIMFHNQLKSFNEFKNIDEFLFGNRLIDFECKIVDNLIVGWCVVPHKNNVFTELEMI